MTLKYESFVYLYPPRPETAIQPSMIGFYEKRNWIAQAKLNGTCNVISVSPNRDKLLTMTRHNELHKVWSPTKESSKAFLSIHGNNWWVFVAELMHSKVADDSLRDINYVHDVLVADGVYLLGKTWTERQLILQNLFIKGDEEEKDTHYIINHNTWLAKNHTSGFKNLFKTLINPEIEGLVLKNPNSVLTSCTKTGNSGWQVKVRKSTKNYGF